MDESADSGTNEGDGPLTQLFGSSGRIRIVEAFLGKRGTELKAAEISKLAGVDRSTVTRNLDALVDVGLVERRETSSGELYRVDEDDPAIHALLEVRRALFGVLTDNPELVVRETDDDLSSEAYVDRAGLVRLFGTPGRVKMIEAFLEAGDEELVGADVADLAGIDRSTVSRNIDTLLDLGLVKRTRRVGNSNLYRTRVEHPVIVAMSDVHHKMEARSMTFTAPSTGTDSTGEGTTGIVDHDRAVSSTEGEHESTRNDSRGIKRVIQRIIESQNRSNRRTRIMRSELDKLSDRIFELESRINEEIDPASRRTATENEMRITGASLTKKIYEKYIESYRYVLRLYLLLQVKHNAMELSDPHQSWPQKFDKSTRKELKRRVEVSVREDIQTDPPVEIDEILDEVFEPVERYLQGAQSSEVIKELIDQVEEDQVDLGKGSLAEPSNKDEAGSGAGSLH